jgi:hypothetical protein
MSGRSFGRPGAEVERARTGAHFARGGPRVGDGLGVRIVLNVLARLGEIKPRARPRPSCPHLTLPHFRKVFKKEPVDREIILMRWLFRMYGKYTKLKTRFFFFFYALRERAQHYFAWWRPCAFTRPFHCPRGHGTGVKAELLLWQPGEYSNT